MAATVMMPEPKTATKTAKPALAKALESATTTPVEQTAFTIPVFMKDGKLDHIVKYTDFPKTPEGRLAFCDWKIECWKDRKASLTEKADPIAVLKRQRDKLEQKMKKLQEELEKAGK